MSSSSITPCWALSATSEVSWVWMTMPGITVTAQAGCGLGIPRPLPASGTSTRHWRQAATGSSSGWSQNRGIWMPSSSAARMISVPLGTLISKPSIVTETRSSRFSTSVLSVTVTISPAQTVEAASSNGQAPVSKCWMYSSRKYWMLEVTGLVAPSPSAQNDRPRMLSDRSRSVSRSSSLPCPCSSRFSICLYQYVPSRHGVHLPQDSCA